MTLDEIGWLAIGSEELEKALKYESMNSKAKETADFLQDVYGTF